jgi:hypothetical protein
MRSKVAVKKILAGAAFAGAALVACSSDDASNDPNLTVTISGEGAGLTGYSFPPRSDNDLAFVDGWEVRFDRILVTVDAITLSDGPDLNPTDQSQTGAEVARAHGPWAVDLTRPGAVTNVGPSASRRALEAQSALLAAEGKDPHAQELVRLRTLAHGERLDPTARYAFGFDIVAATADATMTNLDAAAQTDYAEMQAKGLSVLYVGTATFKGVDCKSSDPNYDFGQLPKSVRFRLGFTSPTTYRNCQNTDLRGRAFDGEEAQRGVQVKENGSTVAQITLHVDHPFWNTVDHDAAELFFDQMAAAADQDGNLVTDNLDSLDFTSFKDRAGKPLPWRSCLADKAPKTGTRAFDPGSVAVNPSASASAALRNYRDYVQYQQSTQGHLNADGLCAIARHFDAPR